MVATDPRMRMAAKAAPPPAEDPPTAKTSILFGGQDAMEEDEALPQAPLSTMNPSGMMNNSLNNNNLNNQKSRWSQQQSAVDLLQTIIAPSPYSHHLTGPTSARFRNALGRITTRPTSDVEAWQALMTEVNACYRSLPNKHGLDADTQNKLDWMESCYGTLLKYFPYSSSHYVTIVEMLLAQSARVGEEDGPLADYGFSLETSQRAVMCQAKAERIFERVLGFTMDGTPSTIQTASIPMKTTTTPTENTISENDHVNSSPEAQNVSVESATSVIAGMCTSSVDLWLLFIRTRSRQAHRQASTMPQADGSQLIREWTVAAYELAIDHAGFVMNNHLLWKQYLAYVRSWVGMGSTTDHALAQKQMLQLRSVYQRLVAHPMTGLDQLWQEYEAFERSQSEALAAALLSEYSPKYQHARTVYLERNRVYSMLDLQLDTKFATPPVDPHDDEQNNSNNQHQQEDIASKMQEEQQFLSLWKRRISYERTNPERLSVVALAQRVRQAYREMACILTRHPEVWHMWSMWELHLGSGGSNASPTEATAAAASSDGVVGASKTSSKEDEKAHRAISVLALGLTHIPDCTLLAHAQAQIVELRTSQPSACLQVMERFLETTSNTLGFVLYQQMVRRYKGIGPARAVFAKARRVLLESKNDQQKRRRRGGKSGNEIDTGGDNAVDGGLQEVPDGDAGGAAQEGTGHEADENGKRWMVTNRLDPSVGSSGAVATNAGAGAIQSALAPSNVNRANDGFDDQAGDEGQQPRNKPGPITWHLYASHATLEHRLNKSPEIAARIYELGLRKHESFLTKPPYVMRYAQLLLELQDTVNLRALMTRAVTACEAVAADVASQDGNSKLQLQQQQGTNSSMAALWDMTLRFESLLSGADPTNVSAIEVVERKRRSALLGPEVEDVSTGGIIGMGGDSVGIGAQKSTIAEQLIRSDGYDISSNIVNGMSRTVEVLEIMGLWGSGGSSLTSSAGIGTAAPTGNHRLRMQQLLSPRNSASDVTAPEDDEMPGGKSDASYQRRLLFQGLLAAGVTSDNAMNDGVAGPAGGSKILSARERLQQGGTAGGASSSSGAGGNFQTPNTAVAMAIQQSPEFLRSMLLLLPMSKMRTAVLSKPPPHLTEMALTTLRQNALPPERPKGGLGDGNASARGALSGNKHRLNASSSGGGADSSDEENGGLSGGGGYGSQFRARQRARQMMAAGQQNGLADGSTK